MIPQKFKIDRVKGHTFLKNYLNRAGSVIDLGMNKGDFARIIHDTYGSCVIGAEANPILASNISRCNGIVCKNVAVSDFDGYVKFSINEENSEASTIVSDSTPISETVIPVPSITLSTFFQEAEVEQVDLLKIDVEGAELDIIETTEPDIFRRCTQIAVEFHRFLYPSHTSRIERAVARMSGLGFRYIDFSNERSDVLFINSNKIDMSGAATATLVFYKYQALIIRRLRRMVTPSRALVVACRRLRP
jgi:FkbM family methyltransferase